MKINRWRCVKSVVLFHKEQAIVIQGEQKKTDSFHIQISRITAEKWQKLPEYPK